MAQRRRRSSFHFLLITSSAIICSKMLARLNVVTHGLLQFRVTFFVFASNQGRFTKKVVVIVRHAYAPKAGENRANCTVLNCDEIAARKDRWRTTYVRCEGPQTYCGTSKYGIPPNLSTKYNLRFSQDPGRCIGVTREPPASERRSRHNVGALDCSRSLSE
jgi:hypothetical protein